jgi:hypothetical protein
MSSPDRRLNWLLAGVVAMAGMAAAAPNVAAQACPGTTVVSNLRRPIGMALSNKGNLIVSETGTATIHSGRISIVSPDGGRRTLIDGLPSAPSDVGDPSGPAGIVMRGRTLYVLMGIGDTVLPAPVPTRQLANPAPASPIFSSVLAVHFSGNVEKATAGFTLSMADQATLAAGDRVMLSNGGGDTIEIELVTNFPDAVPDPLPGYPDIVRGSNPFGIAIADSHLYVTDGGRNGVWQVDLATGSHSLLATFPTIPNPIPVGGPVIEAVPTGIEYLNGGLLVTLFRGVPFAPGTSSVVEIDPGTGQWSTFVGGLKTAIDVLPRGDDYLLLQHSSGPAPFFAGPGVVLSIADPATPPITIANCLDRPTSMLLDAAGTLYVTELLTGRIVALRIP